ncbi:MAG: hypothetical protein Q8J74_05710, partial [Candidatus Didemnitutus sp.]|nr:hypothetical protein [Candidatus Didemnitutus sp.]
AALALTLTVYARLKPKYAHYQDDVTLPVREHTLTFIFDHDAHPATYLQIMRDRYGSRKEFAATLEAFLADSAPRK